MSRWRGGVLPGRAKPALTDFWKQCLSFLSLCNISVLLGSTSRRKPVCCRKILAKFSTPFLPPTCGDSGGVGGVEVGGQVFLFTLSFFSVLTFFFLAKTDFLKTRHFMHRVFWSSDPNKNGSLSGSTVCDHCLCFLLYFFYKIIKKLFKLFIRFSLHLGVILWWGFEKERVRDGVGGVSQ